MPRRDELVPLSKSVRSMGIAVLIGALVLDQVSKAAVTANAALLSGGLPVFPGFALTYLRNDGITFGLFDQAPWWLLTLVALAISFWLASMMWRAKQPSEAMAYGLIVGGALGNIIDRMRFGAVTDFLDIYVGTYHWPSFNFADVAIIGGALLLIFLPVLSRRHREP